MSEQYVTIFCFWGGNVISTEEGLSYDREYEESIRVATEITFKHLVTELCNALGVDEGQVKINITYRYPVIVGTAARYRAFRVKNDNGVRGMMDAITQLKWTHVDLYLDYEVVPVEAHPPAPVHANIQPTPIINSEGEHASNSHDFQSPRSPLHAEFPEWGAVRELAECEEQTGVAVSHVPLSMEAMMAEEDSFLGLDDDSNVNLDRIDDEDVNATLNANQGVEEGEHSFHQPASQMFITLTESSTAASTSRFKNLNWDPKTEEPHVGVIFKNKTELVKALKAYSVRTNTQFQTVESDTRRWAIRCKMFAETPCKWRLRATKLRLHGQFQITRYEGPHTCVYARINQDHSQLDASYVATHVEELVKKDPSVSAGFLALVVKNQFQYVISYNKAWAAKQKAIASIFGDWEESYTKLPVFLHAVQTYNPGSAVEYCYNPGPVAGTAVLQYAFWAFKPCIDAFQFCRPIISVDGTHLYGKYKGKLLIAMGSDANLQILPLAFAIVDEETEDSWYWFLRNLRRHVVPTREGLCLISDRHNGLINAINTPSSGWALPNAIHRYCLRHVEANFKKKFPGSHLNKLMSHAAKTPQIRKFDAIMETIRELNYDAWEYLHKIPKEKWTMCHDGGHRYGNATTNISECFNNVMRGARSLPIAACAQFTFYKVMTYFSNRNEVSVAAQGVGVRHPPQVLDLIGKYQERARGHRIVRFNHIDGVYEVTTGHRVNGGGHVHVICLKDQSCTCGKWTNYHIPCSHVIAVCEERRYDWMAMIPTEYSTDAYVSTYTPRFQPLHDPKYWEVPSLPTFVPNQALKRQKGRPMSTRIQNEMDRSERSTKLRCGICREEGHTRRRCLGNRPS